MLEKKESVRDVGLADPLGDFKEMIANREEDLVTQGKDWFIYEIFLTLIILISLKLYKAVEQMCQVIEHFVKSSFGTSLYDKAVECLKLLRETCAKVYCDTVYAILGRDNY
jgi:hypothetical protein